jgi:short-subunit dehydrogenase
MSTSSPSSRPLAVVTGASSGIGFELAKQFASHDFDLVVAAEDERLVGAALTLRGHGAEVFEARLDLATPAGVEDLYATIMSTGRPVEALVLNAGVGVGGRFIETPLEEDLRLIALNVTSVVHLAKLVIPQMAARRSGRVLITASVAATMPGPYYATYAASKAFDLSFAQAIRHELKDQGVTVTALMPGPTDTDFFRRADLLDTRVGDMEKDNPADVARDGFEALMAGKDHVVAGSAKNRAQVVSGRMLPDRASAAMHARLTEPRRTRAPQQMVDTTQG